MEIPAQNGTAPVASPAVTPASQPVHETARPESPTIQPDTVIQIGEGRLATVGQLVEAAQHALTPEQMTEFETYQKLKSGDPDTILNLFGAKKAADQAVQAGATDPVATEIGQLKEKLARLEQGQAQFAPFYNQLSGLREQAEIKTTVAENAQLLPHLAHAIEKNPALVNKIHGYFQQANAMIRSQGLDPGRMSPNDLRAVQAKVFAYAEQEMAVLSQTFGGWTPTTPSRAVNVAAIDDQRTREERTGGQQPAYRVINGQLVDAAGNTVAHTPDGRILPNVMPGTQAVGSAVGGSGQDPGKTFTMQELRDSVHQRAAQMAALTQP